MKGLAGKVAIVTGGSRGIGKSCVAKLLEEGAKVVFSGRNAKVGQATCDEFKKTYKDVAYFSGNMADEEFCKTLVSETIKMFGGLDLLVNNAFPFTAAAVNATREQWETIMMGGAVGYATMMAEFAKQRGMGKGAIVMVSSISGHIAQPGRWTYNAAKGAVKQLTRCAAMDLAPNIRVNCVSPAWVMTDQVISATPDKTEESIPQAWHDWHLTKHCATPEAIADVCIYLLSDEARAITGADVDCSAGYLAMGPEGWGKDANYSDND